MMQRISRHIVICIGLAAALGLSVVAESAPRINRTVELTIGKADTIDLGQSVADVLVANPAVADVGTLRSSRLYIVGKEIGDTNILAFDDAGNQLADITVRVSIDEKSLRDTVRKFFPAEDIDVSTVRQEIVLRGRVSTPAMAGQVRDLVSRFAAQNNRPIVDLMTVQGEQQVMLSVKVIEAKRDVLRELGVNISAEGSIGSRTDLGIGTAPGFVASPFGAGALLMAPRGNFGPFELGLEGLETDGLVNTLAEPNLTAISGETAGFLAGGEFPVPTARDRDGNITLEFKQFGVSLNFTPTVLSEDRISLQLATEVSTRSDADGVTVGGGAGGVGAMRIPGLSVRRAETTVQMGSGGTIMIAGLIRSDTLDNLSGLPGAKDAPVLGELFKSKSFSRNETELLILVTPYIVKPYATADARMMPQEQPARGGHLLPPVLPPAFDNLPAAQPAPVQKSDARGMIREEPVPAVAPAPVEKAEAPQALPKTADKPARRKTQAAAAPAKQAEPRPSPALAQRFNHNLRTVYGHRTPHMTDAGPYGYIVD